MDGILALGHFCETHGPCVILCTQRCGEEPEQFPHSLSVPWCEACQSVDLEQALVSKEEKICYVTTRTPLQQDIAFLLKQAAVRSLSCEEESKDGGTLYFGDNERGHVLSHSFTLQDSLARGFHRKYSILILMRDKVHLLNSWPFLVCNVKKLAKELQDKAANVNGAEQAQKPQRAVRQIQGLPNGSARSLSQLTGEPAIFSHIHLWFTWMLSSKTVEEKTIAPQPLHIQCNPEKLRQLALEMEDTVFKQACYCILTGIRFEVDDLEVLKAFKQLLPKNWILPVSGDPCKLFCVEGKWCIHWSGCLPPRLPTLQTLSEKALKNEKMTNEVLEPYLTALLTQWFNIACTLAWTPTQDQRLLQALGVQKHDLPLLGYWISNCNITNK